MAGQDLDKFYKDNFGADFTKIKPEQKAIADRVIAILHTYPHLRTPEDTKLLQTINFKDPSVIQGMGVYSAYRAGLMPDVDEGGLDDARYKEALARGVPKQKLDEIVGDRNERLKSWMQSQVNRFAHYAEAPEDAEKEKAASVKVPDKATEAPMTTPLPQQVAPPPVAAPAAPMPEGAPPAPAPMAATVAPIPTVQPALDPMQPETLPQPQAPTNWRKQMLVDGQYVEIP